MNRHNPIYHTENKNKAAAQLLKPTILICPSRSSSTEALKAIFSYLFHHVGTVASHTGKGESEGTVSLSYRPTNEMVE